MPCLMAFLFIGESAKIQKTGVFFYISQNNNIGLRKYKSKAITDSNYESE